MKLSENEQKLAAACGVEPFLVSSLHPDLIYKIMLERVFLRGDTGPHVATLRRVYKAWQYDQVLRMSPEFEALFDVKEPECISFCLTAKQTKAYNEWYKKNKPGYSGAIGGAMEFVFAPTSLGEVVIARNTMTGAKIDLSDYEDW